MIYNHDNESLQQKLMTDDAALVMNNFFVVIPGNFDFHMSVVVVLEIHFGSCKIKL